MAKVIASRARSQIISFHKVISPHRRTVTVDGGIRFWARKAIVAEVCVVVNVADYETMDL